MHTLDVDNPAEGHKLDELARQLDPVALAVRPFVADLAAGTRLADANRHRPSIRTEQPSLHQIRLDMRAEHRLWGRGEEAGDDDVAVAFGPQCKLAHRF